MSLDYKEYALLCLEQIEVNVKKVKEELEKPELDESSIFIYSQYLETYGKKVRNFDETNWYTYGIDKMEFKNILWLDQIFKEKFGFLSEQMKIIDNNPVLIGRDGKKEMKAVFEYHRIVGSHINGNEKDYWEVTFSETKIERHPIKTSEDYK